MRHAALMHIHPHPHVQHRLEAHLPMGLPSRSRDCALLKLSGSRSLGRSNTMGGLTALYLMLHVDAFRYVVAPSVQAP